MSIVETTGRYEAWLRSELPAVIEADLDFKHQQMASAVFPFLRATFYRWAERWTALCPHLAEAPAVLGIGDLHVENFGTWRDAEGRLVWGINDFDEATDLPYTADLVRLATSAALASLGDRLASPASESAAALVAGYEEGLRRGGRPFILAEHHAELRRLAAAGVRDPIRFWDKLDALVEADVSLYPADALEVLFAALPGAAPPGAALPGAPDRVRARASVPGGPGEPSVRARASVPGGPGQPSVRARRAGLGSLGRPRLVAIAHWQGGQVAREVKAMLPSAWDWALGTGRGDVRHGEVITQAVRAADPCAATHGSWFVRRLAPDCARIELADLPAERDEIALLHAMGFEVANVHLGSGAAEAILDDLAARATRHPKWLETAAQRMVEDTETDWKEWRDHVVSS